MVSQVLRNERSVPWALPTCSREFKPGPCGHGTWTQTLALTFGCVTLGESLPL